jgi:hypothetical protein
MIESPRRLSRIGGSGMSWPAGDCSLPGTTRIRLPSVTPPCRNRRRRRSQRVHSNHSLAHRPLRICSSARRYTGTQRPLFGRRGRSDGSTSARRPGLRHRPRVTPGHRSHGPCRAAAAPHIARSLGSSRPGASCLTRPGHRRIVWPHEIPGSGISHRDAGSSPCSGTEEGDISPVFAPLEHAAGDFTTLGKDPLHGGSSPRTRQYPMTARFRARGMVTPARPPPWRVLCLVGDLLSGLPMLLAGWRS